MQRIPLSGTIGDDFFVRQLDDYSCGPASLATVSNIYDVGLSYEDCRWEAEPSPVFGTTEWRMAEIAGAYFPAESFGEKTYTGGVSIACITQGGDGHYVVMLCREKDQVVYYDPYEHELVVGDINKIDWASGDRSVKNWALNFAPIENNSIDKWLAYATPKAPMPSSTPAAPKPPQP